MLNCPHFRQALFQNTESFHPNDHKMNFTIKWHLTAPVSATIHDKLPGHTLWQEFKTDTARFVPSSVHDDDTRFTIINPWRECFCFHLVVRWWKYWSILNSLSGRALWYVVLRYSLQMLIMCLNPQTNLLVFCKSYKMFFFIYFF